MGKKPQTNGHTLFRVSTFILPVHKPMDSEAMDMRYSGLVVGIERVLCSTAHLHRQAWEAVFTALGIPCAGIAALDFSTLGRTQGLDKLLESTNVRLCASERETLLEEKKRAVPQPALHAVRGRPAARRTRAAGGGKGCRPLCRCGGDEQKRRADTQVPRACRLFRRRFRRQRPLPRDAPGLVYRKACEYMDVLPARCLVWEGVAQKALEAEAVGMRAVLGGCTQARAALFSPGPGTLPDGSMLAV